MAINSRKSVRSGTVPALAVAVGLLGAIVSVANSGIAHAAVGPVFTVMNTSESPPDGVWFRNSPHTADTDRVTGHGVYMSEQVRLQCYAGGDAVGAYNNTLWYYVDDVSRPTNAGLENVGFLNAHFINDGLAANVIDVGVPACVNNRPPVPVQPPLMVNSFFNRNAAAAWAKAHSKDPQKFGAMCSWFASNALWAAGFPKSTMWTDQGKYGSTTGTANEWKVPDLPNFIRANFSTTWVDLRNMSINAVPMAEVGDLIVYDWGDGHGQSHVAMVVDIQPGQYPNVSEMGQYDWGLNDWAMSKVGIGKVSTYAERGWTYSEKSHQFLQVSYRGKAHAWLLHINGGVYIPTF